MHVDSTGKYCLPFETMPVERAIRQLWGPAGVCLKCKNGAKLSVSSWKLSPLENCLQLKTKLLMFILTKGHFFDNNIYSIVKRYYWKKKCEKKIDSNFTRARTWLVLRSNSIEQVTTSTPMTTSQDTKAGDDVFNYNCSLLTDCFLFFNFLDAIKEGDGVRVMR